MTVEIVVKKYYRCAECGKRIRACFHFNKFFPDFILCPVCRRSATVNIPALLRDIDTAKLQVINTAIFPLLKLILGWLAYV